MLACVDLIETHFCTASSCTGILLPSPIRRRRAAALLLLLNQCALCHLLRRMRPSLLCRPCVRPSARDAPVHSLARGARGPFTFGQWWACSSCVAEVHRCHKLYQSIKVCHETRLTRKQTPLGHTTLSGHALGARHDASGRQERLSPRGGPIDSMGALVESKGAPCAPPAAASTHCTSARSRTSSASYLRRLGRHKSEP